MHFLLNPPLCNDLRNHAVVVCSDIFFHVFMVHVAFTCLLFMLNGLERFCHFSQRFLLNHRYRIHVWNMVASNVHIFLSFIVCFIVLLFSFMVYFISWCLLICYFIYFHFVSFFLISCHFFSFFSFLLFLFMFFFFSYFFPLKKPFPI